MTAQFLVPDADGVLAPHPLGLVEQTNEEYHSGPGVSKSTLDAVAISPLNYWDSYINPNREPREFKHCFAVGDGTHKLVLEPGTFEHTYAVDFDKSAFPNALNTIDDLKRALTERGMMVSGTKPELARRLVEEGSFPRDQVMLYLEQAHQASMVGKIAISATDYKDMMGMLRALRNHHTAGGLLQNISTEQSFYAVDENGVLRKCRTDIMDNDGGFVGDLKTTDDVSEEGFAKTIVQRRYHVQAAWYLDVLELLYGDSAPKTFAFIAAQKKRPYDVAVHIASADQIEEGRRLYQRDLATLIECNRTGIYHGADGGKVITSKLPRWYRA